MIIKHKELDVPTELGTDPFKHCKLGREQFAHVLTDVVSEYADGFVMALDNRWGTGKTTFVRMWRQHLINHQFKTVLFNAWEHDFDDKPLPAILAELKELMGKINEAAYKKVVEKGSLLLKSIAPAIAKAAAKKVGADEVLQDLAKAIAEGGMNVLDEEIKQYTDKKKGLSEFKDALEDYVAKVKGDKPLVFIIDELDRCRPDYAVQVLEQIKHLFSVEGIVFVLAIDKVQLGHAVRGAYGSDNIDADEYLRRFIDVTLQLPEPPIHKHVEYLYDYYEYAGFIESPERMKYKELQNDKNNLLKFAVKLFQKPGVTLRIQHQIFSYARLILTLHKVNNYIFPEISLLLVYIYLTDNILYKRISRLELSHQELLDEFVAVMVSPKNEDEVYPFANLAAWLVTMYNNALDHKLRIALVVENAMTREHKTNLVLKDVGFGSQAILGGSFSQVNRDYDKKGISLKHLTSKIEMLDLK